MINIIKISNQIFVFKLHCELSTLSNSISIDRFEDIYVLMQSILTFSRLFVKKKRHLCLLQIQAANSLICFGSNVRIFIKHWILLYVYVCLVTLFFSSFPTQKTWTLHQLQKQIHAEVKCMLFYFFMCTEVEKKKRVKEYKGPNAMIAWIPSKQNEINNRHCEFFHF